MNKKFYLSPEMKEFKLAMDTNVLLDASVESGGIGIGGSSNEEYGG